MKNFISIKDMSTKELNELLDLAGELSAGKKGKDDPLAGKILGLVFQKASNRTRVSFEAGMFGLGGQVIYLSPGDIKLGIREPAKDVARALSRYLDGIVARTFSHKDILQIAEYASVPVINGLSDLFHPCQALGDVFTIKQKLGKLKGVNVSFIGDGNNVLHSLLIACGKLGVNLTAATPKKYKPNADILKDAQRLAGESGGSITLVHKAQEAVSGNTNVIYTDVWVSMGQESAARKKIRAFKGFQVNEKLTARASKKCLIMHCLPAHRGEEIAESVLEGPNSIVFDQAENRMHAQKALLLKLLK